MSVTQVTMPASPEVLAELSGMYACGPNDEGLTNTEMAKLWGVHRATALYRIANEVESGNLIKGSAMRIGPSGMKRRVCVYRPAPKRKKRNAS
jgi:hypothetical protein